MKKLIEQVIGLCEKDAEFAENYRFNHLDTIKRINLYLNNRFLERKDGIFWNISTHRVQHFAKNIELDTKDLVPYGIGEANQIQAWVLGIKLAQWKEEKKLALVLNDLAEAVASYGSAVWKIVDHEVHLVELANLRFNPLVKSLKDSDVVEYHYLSRSQVMEKKKVWKNVDKLLETDPEDGLYTITEFHGYEDEKYYHYFGSGEGDNHLELYKEEMDPEDFPYVDFHLTKYEGRWMRIGVVERLFSLQEMANKLVNYNDQASEIASLLLFRAGNDVVGNVLEQAENGQIINSQDIQQIGITNRGLSDFINNLREIETHADKLCLTPDVITGEALPSGTPFRSLAALTNAARSAFKMIRENIAEKIGYTLKEKILPEEVKKWNRGELLDIAGDEGDMEMYDTALRNRLMMEKLAKGESISQLDADVDEHIQKKGRKLDVPKGFFNFKYGIKFNIAGEAIDKSQLNASYESALTMVSQNPGLLQIPLFKQYLGNNNIPFWRVKPEEVQALQEGGRPMIEPGAMEPQQDKLMAQVDS